MVLLIPVAELTPNTWTQLENGDIVDFIDLSEIDNPQKRIAFTVTYPLRGTSYVPSSRDYIQITVAARQCRSHCLSLVYLLIFLM